MLKEVEDARAAAMWAALGGISAVHGKVGFPEHWCWVVIILVLWFDREPVQRDKPFFVIGFGVAGLVFLAVKGLGGVTNFTVCLQIGIVLQICWRVFKAFRAIRREKKSAATS